MHWSPIKAHGPFKDKGDDSDCVTKCHKDVAVIFITSAIMEPPRAADIPSLKTQRLRSQTLSFSVSGSNKRVMLRLKIIVCIDDLLNLSRVVDIFECL